MDKWVHVSDINARPNVNITQGTKQVFGNRPKQIDCLYLLV